MRMEPNLEPIIGYRRDLERRLLLDAHHEAAVDHRETVASVELGSEEGTDKLRQLVGCQGGRLGCCVRGLLADAGCLVAALGP